MDQFYLQHVDLYQALVKGVKPEPPALVARESLGVSPDIVVCARIRPLLEDEVVAGFPCALFPRVEQPGVVDVHDLYHRPRGRPILKSFDYKVDRLFNSETTTEDIYEQLVAGLVPFAANGGIGTLFAYGQTGSGKTFTVSRLEQLVVDSLMDEKFVGQRQVSMTIFELAGNSAYDLLGSRSAISILEDSFGVTQLFGAVEHPVLNREDAMSLIERAASFRRTASTLKNDASSRSHAICRLRIQNPSNESDGFLYLIDLAGSEAARDIAVHGADRMRETREINMSLSVLKDCIRGKVQADAMRLSSGPKSKQKKPHVPFRQSSLTKVLKHVFDPAGNRACKTVVIACVNPSLADIGPSKNTLRYAEMLRVLVPAGQVEQSQMIPMTWTNTQLKDWIEKNSGNPPVSSAFLAPTESGAQLLRLPAGEIERRCMKTEGVTIEQAKAVRSKLWQLHLGSQRANKPSVPPQAANMTEPRSIMSPLNLGGISSSGDSSFKLTDIPFKERIRPGMVVSWNYPSDHASAFIIPEDFKLAVVLSAAETITSGLKDILGNEINPAPTKSASDGEASATSLGTRYLCALVVPGLIGESYEVALWRQIVLDVDMMDKEIFLEYDSGTRYYYISV